MLADQVEELHKNGVDICSENTYLADDFDDFEIFDETQVGNLNQET